MIGKLKKYIILN